MPPTRALERAFEAEDKEADVGLTDKVGTIEPLDIEFKVMTLTFV